MIHHETSIHLHRPAHEVFAFLSDPQKLLLWQSNLLQSEMLTEGPLRLGSRFREVRRMGPRESEIRGEVSDFEMNRRLATRTETRPQATVRYVLEPEEGGTHLHYEFALQSTGLMRLMEPMIGSSIRKDSERDLQKLQQLLES